jgi:hypothetical protein
MDEMRTFISIASGAIAAVVAFWYATQMGGHRWVWAIASGLFLVTLVALVQRPLPPLRRGSLCVRAIFAASAIVAAFATGASLVQFQPAAQLEAFVIRSVLAEQPLIIEFPDVRTTAGSVTLAGSLRDAATLGLFGLAVGAFVKRKTLVWIPTLGLLGALGGWISHLTSLVVTIYSWIQDGGAPHYPVGMVAIPGVLLSWSAVLIAWNPPRLRSAS